MARISTYKKDGSLDPKDKLVGSSYEGLANGLPKYSTSSYTLDDIAKFLTGYQYLGDDAFDGWTLQTKISDAFLSNSNGDIVGFKEALKQASEQIVLDLDLSTNAIISGINESLGDIDLEIGGIIQTSSNINTAVNKISTAFSFDGEGYPTGFGTTIEENIYGLAQAAIDLTPFALNDDLLQEAGLLQKVRDAFTFDANGNVDNFNTTLATASADQVRGIFVSDGLAYGADVDKIKTAVGTFDEEGNLLNLSEGLSQKISFVISTDTATLATQIDGVQAAFGTFDPETGELISYSTALNSHVSSVVSGDGYAASTDLNTLTTFVKGEDGTGGLVGSISTVNELAGTANTTAEAAAFKATSLGSVFGEYDENGNFTPSATASYFESIKTYVNNDSAVAEKANNLAITIGDAESGLVAQANDVTTLAGNLQGYLEASRTINVDANGNIASMQLYADANTSEIRFTADAFKVWNGTEGVAPFIVENNQVKIKSANIQSISFGSLTDVPETFITTVIYADDTSGTNPTTSSVGKNFVSFYNGAAKWVDGDPLPTGLVFRQITGPQGATGDKGDKGDTGDTGPQGATGDAGYTPIKNIDYFDGIPGDSANVVITDATAEQCSNGGKVLKFYVGDTLIDTQIVCNGVDGIAGLQGEQGNTGAAGIRIATGIIWYSFGTSTQPATPSNSGITFNFDNGTFSSLPSGWQVDPPQMEAGTSSNLYWTSRYQVFESSSGSGSGTPSFYTPIRAFAFNQVVTFSSLGVSGSTIIDGSRITTGFIRSNLYDAPDAGETYADEGTAIYLDTGNIISKNFAIVNGNAYFRGEINSSTGVIGGWNIGANTLFGDNVELDSRGNGRVQTFAAGGNVLIAGDQIVITNGALNITGAGSISADTWSTIDVMSFTDRTYHKGGITSRMSLYIEDDDDLSIYTRGGIRAAGPIVSVGNIIAYASSDERLKENIKPIDNALDKVKSIGGYEFDWNDNQKDFTGHDIGVIAQEIQSIAPELVTERPDGYLAVKYEKIVAILIQGMKEQQDQIEELKNRLDGLTK